MNFELPTFKLKYFTSKIQKHFYVTCLYNSSRNQQLFKVWVSKKFKNICSSMKNV